MWDLQNSKNICDLIGHQGSTTCMDFHPNEFLMASGSADKIVKFWDLDKFKLISNCGVGNSEIRSVVFSEDGKALLTASNDNLRVGKNSFMH